MRYIIEREGLPNLTVDVDAIEWGAQGDRVKLFKRISPDPSVFAKFVGDVDAVAFYPEPEDATND